MNISELHSAPTAHGNSAASQNPGPQSGTSSLCQTCLTLLSHVVTHFGDGSHFQTMEVAHPVALSECFQGASARPMSLCVICQKTIYFFNVLRRRSAMEDDVRSSPSSQWNVKWRVEAPMESLQERWQFPLDEVSVIFVVTHQSGTSWRMSGFDLFLDYKAHHEREFKVRELYGGEDLTADYPCITALDKPPGIENNDDVEGQWDFYGTLSPGTVRLAFRWMLDCNQNHEKCHQILHSSSTRNSSTFWLPDRLVHVHRVNQVNTNGSKSGQVRANVVEKTDLLGLYSEDDLRQILYLSLSHCWGQSPDATAPRGERSSSVLTESNLQEWKQAIPLSTLPKTFLDAIKVCVSLGFKYIWIDSLCIIQDSVDDWQAQSATMGDVYKFAWMNIAALSSTSDHNGFINEARDPRIEFGFRTSFATIFGRPPDERNDNGQECIFLKGISKLLWKAPSDNTETNPKYLPLFQRAWVYQERSLSRRILGFTDATVYYTCDQSTRSECPPSSQLTPEGLRSTLQSAQATISEDEEARKNGTDLQTRLRLLRESLTNIDSRWNSCLTNYTSCKLTVSTDKLIAFSAIAADLATFGMMSQHKYLAGLWSINLPFQMAWFSVGGRTTARRKGLGDAGYVAPSWSWASIEAAASPRLIFPSQDVNFALCDVSDANVVLETDFAYGSISAGWMRVRGRLNKIKSASWVRSPFLIDQTADAKLYFAPDTVEGVEILQSSKSLAEVVWMPLTMHFDARMIEAKALVMAKVDTDQIDFQRFDFIRPSDRVYRRIGTGNFGRIPSKLRMDKLLLNCGAFPDMEVADGQGRRLAQGFRRSDDGFEDFVLI